MCLDIQISHWILWNYEKVFVRTWWRHQMETFSALLAFCAGNSPVTGEFPAQRPVTRGFDVLFDMRMNERLSKQSWGWWFEKPSRHYDVTVMNWNSVFSCHKSHNVPCPTIHHSKQKCSILNDILWNMGQMHCGICKIYGLVIATGRDRFNIRQSVLR